MEPPRQYIAIDLKSFYASVECVERKLDPLDACLVVADSSRTEKTICLAVSPALKSFGIGGRPRLFEVVQRVRQVNSSRGRAGRSTSGAVLASHPELAVDFLVAPPRMALYVEYSTRIYEVYLRYIAPEDIHIYSIDEVFIDATAYLGTYRMTAHELAIRMIRDILAETGITATVGIGTNMYLCKVAMDIVAKKMPPDKDGVRIAELDETSYRRQLWTHTPLTDFWRVGAGTARRLAPYGILTMGDIARCSIRNEKLLYDMFGVNAELLIDHAWGWEPVTMELVKAYEPETHSICSGQVLSCAYSFDKALTVALEMADALALELVEKGLVCSQIILHVGYDAENLRDKQIEANYTGRIKRDWYGREVPVSAHGSANFHVPTSSGDSITTNVAEIFDKVVNRSLLVRRLTLTANNVIRENRMSHLSKPEQLELFTDYEQLRREREAEAIRLAKEKRRQMALIGIKRKFGKNAILKGLNFADGATQRDRNRQIGGHHE